ncbi:MAG: hypothetical protein ACHREM_24415 [Polyangiales bacterium]
MNNKVTRVTFDTASVHCEVEIVGKALILKGWDSAQPHPIGAPTVRRVEGRTAQGIADKILELALLCAMADGMQTTTPLGPRHIPNCNGGASCRCMEPKK